MKFGTCQWCNKRMPLKPDGTVVIHVKPGTRKRCNPDEYFFRKLPKTETKAILGRNPEKWRGPRGWALPSDYDTTSNLTELE